MSSNAPRRPVRDLRFFLTVPHACSYLPDREATTLFLDPQESPVPGVYDSLSLLGFRRSGRHLYRPHCEAAMPAARYVFPLATLVPTARNEKFYAATRILQRG